MCRHYGFKDEDLGRLTFRKVDMYLRKMGIHLQTERAFEAALHDKQLKTRIPDDTQESSISDEERALLDRQLDARMAELQGAK